MDHDAGRAVGRTTFGDVHVDGHAAAVLGDYNVYNHVALSPEEVEKIARRELTMALAYDSMNARRMQLAQDPAQHVEWIWTEQALGGPGFADWLGSWSPVFWITGKPGSGKSTLMKYVAESARTKSLLPAHSDRQWLFLHFYFDFRAGSGIANSVDGLLRSMLFKLARQSDDAADAIRHDPKGVDYHEVRSNLDRQELLHLLQVSTSAISPKYDICGFVDGLDEISGHKLCVASRPEFMLAQYLGTRPQFKMQAYNFRTIQAYVEDVLQQIPAQIHPNVSLAESTVEVVQAAEGVILWARRAMYHLVQSVVSGETEKEVYQALNEFPRQLNDVYERLLQGLEPSKQLESAVFLHLIQTGAPSTSIWDLHCAIVFLRDSNMLPSWPKQKLSCDSFLLRLRSRTGSMVDIVKLAFSTGTGVRSQVRKAQLFHKTLDTYLTTTGWARRTMVQAEPSVQPEAIWLQMCTSCLLQNELSEVAFSRILNPSNAKHNRSTDIFSIDLQPTMFEDEKVFLVLRRRNSITSATDFLHHALSTYPYYLRQAVQYRTKPLDDCHRWIMGSKLMLLHPWVEERKRDKLSSCDCAYQHHGYSLYSWSSLARLRPAQRAVFLAQVHRMYRQSAGWLHMDPGDADDILAKAMLNVFIRMAGTRAVFDEANNPDFFALLKAFSGLASFIDDSDLSQAVYYHVFDEPRWVTNMILLTVFNARSRVEHNQLRWIPEDLLLTYYGVLSSRGCNLLGLWVYSIVRPRYQSHWNGVKREQLTILLASGLDINAWCTAYGPPVHTMLTWVCMKGWDLDPAWIRCLLDHGADATISGPHGTPLEIMRNKLRSQAPEEGCPASVNYINSGKIARFLEEHLGLVTER